MADLPPLGHEVITAGNVALYPLDFVDEAGGNLPPSFGTF
jgi:hypothetical protein